jgi:hypothetical protein
MYMFEAKKSYYVFTFTIPVSANSDEMLGLHDLPTRHPWMDF